jgi:hypothetical protein
MMRDRIRSFLKRNLIDTVPDEMDQCLDCGRPRCSAAEYRACAARLARADELRRQRDQAGVAPRRPQ